MEKIIFFENEVLDGLLERLNNCQTAEEKQTIMTEFNRSMEKLPEKEREKISLASRLGAIDMFNLFGTVGLAGELKRLGEFLTYSRIVGHYFKKTRGWFYHKLNGDLVNGKPAFFTSDELERLSEAFLDISKQLEKTAGVLKEVARQSKELSEKIVKG